VEPEQSNLPAQPTTTIKSKSCKCEHHSFNVKNSSQRERIKTIGPSPAKNFHYQNNRYNQCLPKSLGTDKHQIITQLW
jgi:hypothetical protein